MSSGDPVEGESLVESALECESAFEVEPPVEDAFLVEGNPVESPIQYPPQTEPPSPRPQVYKSMSSFKVEPVEAYREGGYHIVHIGDILGQAGAKQYKIIHKLGFGEFSTVWLAQDLSDDHRYVAIKIIKAEASKDAFEHDMKVVNHLYEIHSEVCERFIQLMDGHFWVNGPNGRCLCLVSSVAGPSIAQLTQSGLRLSGPHAQRIALQLTQCVSFLHSNSEGIGHGDLTSNNVLLELANFDHCTEDEVYQRLGRPKEDNVRTLVGDSNGSQAPKYLVEPADLTQLNSYLTGNIRVIDFGESFFLGNPRNKIGTPLAFRAPEIFFNRNVLNGKASDVWALACTIYEIRAGDALFEIEFGDENTIQDQIIKALGPITFRTFSGIPGDIEILGGSESDYLDLISLVRRIQRTKTGALISKPDLENGGLAGQRISPEEADAFHDLLEGVLRYSIEERLSADQMLRHRWFSMKFE